MNRFLTASMEAGSGVGQVVPHKTRAVLSGGGGGVSDANAVGSGITVAATSTATPIGPLIRVAVRRRFLTRRAIGLKTDNVVPPDHAATTARRICCFLAVPTSAHRRTVSRDHSRRTGN